MRRGSASSRATRSCSAARRPRSRPNAVIAEAMRDGLEKAGLPVGAIGLVEDTSRDSAIAFMQLDGVIDCLIPRGAPTLVATVQEHATVPYVLDGAGNCHVYVDADADLAMAEVDRGQRQDPAPRSLQRGRDLSRAPRGRRRLRAAGGCGLGGGRAGRRRGRAGSRSWVSGRRPRRTSPPSSSG